MDRPPKPLISNDLWRLIGIFSGKNKRCAAWFTTLPYLGGGIMPTMLHLLNIANWPWYKRLDVALLRRINRDWTNPVLDAILPWCRESMVWIPFYLFVLVFAFINLGRSAWYWVLGLAVTVGLSDQVSSGLIKNWVARERPCRDPEVASLINLRIEHCSGAYSFTSSHAANHFAVAAFIIITLSPLVGRRTRWLLLWAGIISYAQMYVGVHYPLDILGGTAVGLLVGYASGRFFNRMVGLPPLQPVVKSA